MLSLLCLSALNLSIITGNAVQLARDGRDCLYVHEVKCRHRIYSYKTIAVLWV